MKIFSALGRQTKPDRATAWAYLMANAAVLPGLGTCLSGRRAGLIQMGLALAGFGLTAVWAVWFLKAWIQSGQVPLEIGPHLGKALSGVALFGISWIWALAGSLVTLRRASHNEHERKRH